MRSTDQMLSRLVAEIEEKQVFIDGVVEDAEKQGRDLNSQEMELATRARTRVGELQPQLDQLLELRRMGSESRAKLAELAPFMREQPGPAKEIEYRSAGEYVLDQWRSGLGDGDASGRLEIYNRAASHQTTANSPGLIPTPIVGPVVDFIDASRPLVNALGPRQLPGQNWSRPKVTVHTTVGAQSAEKAELTSQAMTITKLSGVAVTYGGYVNVSRQAVDFTQPGCDGHRDPGPRRPVRDPDRDRGRDRVRRSRNRRDDAADRCEHRRPGRRRAVGRSGRRSTPARRASATCSPSSRPACSAPGGRCSPRTGR